MSNTQPEVRAHRRRHRRRPNLLFVFADQLRACDLDNGKVRTPALDRLAAGGVRVTRCFANAPVCGPSRAMLLTGTFPQRNGVLANDLPIRTDCPSLGTIARSNGYRTGYIGKWHLDGVPRTRFTPPGPRRLGFDDFWAAYNCTHDYFRPRYYRDAPELIERAGYEPQVQTDLALEFLDAARPRRRAADDPFCLVVSWGPPHDPYARVPEPYRAMYDPAAIVLRPNVQPETDNPLAANLDCRRATADYFAATTALDEQFGRLLAHLEETGADDDTLVVFTSDHGDMLWSHGRMKKQAPYEESIRVPFVARLPGVLPAGRTCDHTLVGLVDVLPTLCGLLEWAVPETVQGRDGSRALRGARGRGRGTRATPVMATGAGEAAGDAVFLAEYVGCGEARRQGLPPWRALRTRRHTYAETVGRRPWLLFDDVADPYQMDNLVDQSDHAALREDLARALTRWLRRTDDPFLDGNEMLAHYVLTDAWREKQASFPE